MQPKEQTKNGKATIGPNVDSLPQTPVEFIEWAIQRKRDADSRFSLKLLNGLVGLAYQMKMLSTGQFMRYVRCCGADDKSAG